MDDQVPAGPSGRADWETRQEGGATARLPLLILPDAANPKLAAANRPLTYYCLSKVPLLVRDAAGDPVFSLTLILDRQPRPNEVTIYPLIRQGILQFSATLAVSSKILTQLAKDDGGEYRPLFVRDALFKLLSSCGDKAEQVLVSAGASGTGARASLGATLDRAETLDVIAALEGNRSKMKVRVIASYRAAAIDQALRLYGSWAALYDYLESRTNVDGEITRGELRARFAEMLRAGLVSVSEVSPSNEERPALDADANAIFDLFMHLSTVILKRETIELEAADEANRYSLRGRPHPMFHLDYTQTIRGSGHKSIDLGVPLDELLGGALRGLDRNRFIHLISPGGVGDEGWGPVPPRSTTSESQSHSRNNRAEASGPIKLAAVGGTVQSIASALKPNPNATIAPQALVAGQVAGGIKHWELEDIRLEQAGTTKLRSLPVVGDQNALIWPDRVDPAKFWYAPSFELILPAQNADPLASSFLFTYEQVGVAADGKVALTGMLRFTLRAGISAEVQAALAARGGATGVPLPTNNLSVILEVPFVDRSDNSVKQHKFAAEVGQTGATITATVRLLNEWVNLCYGALALADFQQGRPARVHVAYSYQAYTLVQPHEVALVYGGKTAVTPLVFSAEPRLPSDTPYFDAAEATYRLPTGDLRLKREASQSGASIQAVTRDSLIGAALAGSMSAAATATVAVTLGPHATAATLGHTPMAAAVKAKPIGAELSGAAMVARPAQRPTTIARPELKPSINIGTLIREKQYATRSFVRQDQQPVFVSCRDYGAFYIETSRDGSRRSVGCRNHAELGRQTSYQQYEEVPALALPFYRVYRSLQQPGRFLILPNNYRIARKEPPGAYAYQACALVYAEMNPDTAANNRYIVQATLEPDIPPYARRELRSRLANITPHEPVLEYPTEVAREIVYNWAAASVIRERDAVKMPGSIAAPDSFMVTLVTDLSTGQVLMAMLQRSGVSLSIDFKLPDGSVMSSGLTLQLSNLAGPWTSGPVEVALAGASATITNKIDREVAVSELKVYQSSTGVQRVPVDTNLAPSASRTVALPGVVTEAFPVYRVTEADPATLEEVRIFSENIQTNVIFVNQVNYANQALKKLEVQARIEGVAGTYPVRWRTSETGAQPSAGEVEITLPITTYLAKRILQFQVTKTSVADVVSTTPWRNWDLFRDGNVVSLTSDLIQ